MVQVNNETEEQGRKCDECDKQEGCPIKGLKEDPEKMELEGVLGITDLIIQPLVMKMDNLRLRRDLEAGIQTLAALLVAAGGNIRASKEDLAKAVELYDSHAIDKTEHGDGSVSWVVNEEKLNEYRASQTEAGGGQEAESGSRGSPEATDETAEG